MDIPVALSVILRRTILLFDIKIKIVIKILKLQKLYSSKEALPPPPSTLESKLMQLILQNYNFFF